MGIKTLYHEDITPSNGTILKADFLVIGAGVAGLRAAIELAPAGQVLVLAKGEPKESSSEYAQGGIAAALADDDEVSLHEQDTLAAGDGLCDRDAVHTLVEEGPRAIEDLIAWGAEFDREGPKLSFTREGAHSRNRILHAHGDSTGREIVRTLWQKANTFPTIRVLTFTAIIELLDRDGAVTGALAFDAWSGQAVFISARAVLLATGGLGRVYAATTNPDVATGDGVALAYRAGAEVADIEFVQFHPTALHLAGAPCFLLSEALRGEGAYLRNEQGERFMSRYHELGELAPRDVVSRSIVQEIQLTGSQDVFLDLTHFEPGRVSKRFPRIYETCLRFGIDLATTPAPVHPAAHYAMGGVRTDLMGQTSVPNLYAAGEVAATGVHGANRLASNSLLEGLVFGARAGKAMREQAGLLRYEPDPVEVARFPEISEGELRALAWRDLGVVREGKTLEAAIATLEGTPLEARQTAPRLDYEVRNMHQLALLIARCAAAREESRGGHWRIDYPTKSPRFQKHSSIRLKETEVKFRD
ncbi:MAG: L-aspartate oxidase [Bryobacteraceae bacterium]